MLYSAAGVTLPSQHGAPPMTTQRPTLSAKPGSRASASAMLVSGPSVTSVRPGSAAAMAHEGVDRVLRLGRALRRRIAAIAEGRRAHGTNARPQMPARQRRRRAEIHGDV